MFHVAAIFCSWLSCSHRKLACVQKKSSAGFASAYVRLIEGFYVSKTHMFICSYMRCATYESKHIYMYIHTPAVSRNLLLNASITVVGNLCQLFCFISTKFERHREGLPRPPYVCLVSQQDVCLRLLDQLHANICHFGCFSVCILSKILACGNNQTDQSLFDGGLLEVSIFFQADID